MKVNAFYIFILLLFFVSCTETKKQAMTPWGTSIGEDSIPASSSFGMSDIQNNGELIMLTLSGPESYYDYHGHGMGLQYLLCEKFAEKIGVSLRVEVCKDTTEMVERLKRGEADVIAYQIPKSFRGIRYAGVSDASHKSQWAVQADNQELADSLDQWFKPGMVAKMKKEENFLLSTRSITRHVYSPMLDRSGGVISHYDHLFRRYAPLARWDWRLLAAQCYQESTFDPKARSWAGACGLMQIMPSTADHLGLPMSAIHDAESNVAAAAKYMAELQGHFSDIGDPTQRVLFALAAYNGGFHHIRDAMNLTRKHGGNPYNWGHVREYVLRLAQPAYYRDPVVKYGFMRGTETADYVDRIRARWSEYCGGASFHDSYRGGSRGIGGGAFHGAPMKSKRHYQGKYHI